MVEITKKGGFSEKRRKEEVEMSYYVEMLEDLIRIDTSVPPGLNYERVIEYLEPLFSQVGCETQRIAIPKKWTEGREGRINLLAHRRTPKKPRLIFYTHIDVVPAEGWDAFTPREKEGKVYGRGAADMKGGIVALLLALEKVKEESLNYDLSVMVTTDEEMGQVSQLRYLGQFLQPLEGAYIFDLDSGFGYVGIAGLGAIQMEIRVKGKSVHSGLAHQGVNAIEKASLLINALLKLKKEIIQRRSEIDAYPDTGLKKMEARLNINVIQGGLKVNIVPDSCLISIDRRLIPEESLAEAEEELRKTLSLVEEVEWEIEKINKMVAHLPFDDPIVDKLERLIKKVTGKTGRYGTMGSFGLPNVTPEWGAKIFSLGPSRPESNIHGKNECVRLGDIEDLAEIVSQFLQS